MSDLHETRDPEREPQIDTVGWLFLAFALASVTAAAAMVAYKANDTMVANTTVSHVVVVRGSAKVSRPLRVLETAARGRRGLVRKRFRERTRSCINESGSLELVV
jgi:hypothetical protein